MRVHIASLRHCSIVVGVGLLELQVRVISVEDSSSMRQKARGYEGKRFRQFGIDS